MNILLNPMYLGNFCNNSLTRKVRPFWDTPGVNQPGCGKPFPRNIIYKWLIFHIELLVYPRLIGGFLSHVPGIPSYSFLDSCSITISIQIHPPSWVPPWQKPPPGRRLRPKRSDKRPTRGDRKRSLRATRMAPRPAGLRWC